MNPPGFWRRFAQVPRLPLAGLAVALALLTTLGALFYRTVQNQAETADWVAHTYQVVSNLHRVRSTLQAAESAQRGYSNSGKEEFETACQDNMRNLPGQLVAVRRLVHDNPQELGLLAELSAAMDARLALIRIRLDERRRLGADALSSTYQTGAGLKLMEAVNNCVEKMIGIENKLLAQRRQAREEARERTRALLVAGWITSVILLATVFTGLLRQMMRANRAELATLRSNQQLKEVNNELRAFSYSVAHDLRAPLRVIDGFSRVVLEEAGETMNEEARKGMERISGSARMMAQLIEDLLALSKISYQPLKSARVEMKPLVQGVFDQLIEAEQGRTVELEIGELPPAAGDVSLLRQVWQNLIANALKFTRRREKARIEIGAASGGSDFVTYFVRDNGAGFDMQYANKLFGAFQRLHRPTDFEGTGIGLALVQRIVVRHGGTVWAEGKEDEGARFAFTLPEWPGSRLGTLTGGV